jgi:hypothetical protein
MAQAERALIRDRASRKISNKKTSNGFIVIANPAEVQSAASLDFSLPLGWAEAGSNVD